jgi:hypothetical protein
MPTEKPRLKFTGLKTGESAPPIAVYAVGRDGKVTHTARLDAEGRFDLPAAALKSAHRILIGPGDAEPTPDTQAAYARYRPAAFAAALEKGELAIARPQWEIWRLPLTCVSGSVRLCRRPPWWFDDLVVLAKQPLLEVGVTRASPPAIDVRAIGRLPAARSLPELIAWPFRCATICNGIVEVYRRTCCCEPWVVFDPRFDDLFRVLEEIPIPVPPLPDPPPVGPRPGPGPDPVPFASAPMSPFLKEGALDELAVFAARDLAALKALSPAERPAYVNARPYLRCRGYSCGAPVKVAEGEIQPDGRFNICFLDLGFVPPRCHHEYAYKVRQRFGPFWFTVYNGVAANIWFHRDDDARLTSYHPFAFACRENGEPGTGAFVYLDIIGDTSSHELETPNATAWDQVAAPGVTSGLVFPAAVEPLNRHRNWGGVLKINYMFSEDLKFVGAKYYRISIVEADATGAPASGATRFYYDQGLSWTKSVIVGTSVDIVPVSLGPNPAPIGGENNLYEIPYDTEADWEAGQYHAHLNTNDGRWNNPLVRHLVTVEIFDSAGKRLRPNGTPATGQSGAEGTAAFTYRRKTAATGPTLDVPFGALTHLFWWDNRPVHAKIEQLVQDGTPSTAECQFMVGSGGSDFGILYRAYHEQVLFNRNHRIWWKRGLAGATGDILNPGLGNVGFPGAPGPSPTVDFSVMLGPHARCAFTVFLDVLGKMTDGDDLDFPWAGDSAAFALEIQ